MARLHDALKSHGYEGHDLEVYLVRLLFCLFADDTGIFPRDSFFRYIEQSRPDGSDLSERIAKLFMERYQRLTDLGTRAARPHFSDVRTRSFARFYLDCDCRAYCVNI